MLLILLSEIDPYTLKIGDLSEDLAVILLSRYHYYSIYSSILCRIHIYNGYLASSIYSHGDIVVHLLYTANFVTLDEVKISYSKASYFTAGSVMERQWRVFPEGPHHASFLF